MLREILGYTKSGKAVCNVKSSKGFTEEDLSDAESICSAKLGILDDLSDYFYRKFKAAQNGTRTYKDPELARKF